MNLSEVDIRREISEPEVVLPGLADVQAVSEGKACFALRGVGYFIGVSRLWKNFLTHNRSFSLDPKAEEEAIQSAGLLGLMNRADDGDKRRASRAIERPLIALSQAANPSLK